MFNVSLYLSLQLFKIQGVTRMILSDAFDRYAKKTPVSVMVRATIENVFSAELLDVRVTRCARHWGQSAVSR